jgi:hypothetical protein
MSVTWYLTRLPAHVYYRPFDIRHTFYTGKSKGFHAYPRAATSNQMLNSNIAILFERFCVSGYFNNILLSKFMIDLHILGTAHANGYMAPPVSLPRH